MLERLIEDGRRRERVIRIFPNERSAWRLLGALLAEQHEGWPTGRRWLNMEDSLRAEGGSEGGRRETRRLIRCKIKRRTASYTRFRT